ncbi:hypothetical protein D3C87_1503080 [compost metagenome]
MTHFDVTARRFAFFAQLDGTTGDLGRFVTDALQVDHRLGNADDQAQVGRCRLTTGQNAQAFFVDVAFHLVDLVVDLAHLLGQAGVGLDQRGHRVVDLLFHQPAHGQEVAAHLFKLGVELRGNVVGKAFFTNHLFRSAKVASFKLQASSSYVQVLESHRFFLAACSL